VRVGRGAASLMDMTGGTACEASTWRSNSVLVCKLVFGLDFGLSLHLSINMMSGMRLLSFMYNTLSVSGAGASNVASSGAASVTVVGCGGFGVSGVSAAGRVGGSAWGGSVWRSDSGLVCRADGAGHGGGGRTVAVSSGLQRGSLSAAVSYDAPSVSGAGASNVASSGAASVTVVGCGGFGVSGVSAAGRVGGSAWGGSVWRSDSGLVCRAGAGHGGGGRTVAVSSGLQRGSLSAAVSYDAPSVSGAGASNVASSGAASMTVVGQVGIGLTGSSARSGVGPSACQTSVWASSSGVVCKSAGGLMGGAAAVVSVNLMHVASSSFISFDVIDFRKSLDIMKHQLLSSGSSNILFLSNGFASHDVSIRVRISITMASDSHWLSDSSLTCKSPSGFGFFSFIVFSAPNLVVKHHAVPGVHFYDIEPACIPVFDGIYEDVDDSLKINASCRGKADNITLTLSNSTAEVHRQTLKANCTFDNLYIKTCRSFFSVDAFSLRNNTIYALSIFSQATSTTAPISNDSRENFSYLPDLKFTNAFREIAMDYLPFERNISIENSQDFYFIPQLIVNDIFVHIEHNLFSLSNGSCTVSIKLPNLTDYNISSVSGGRGTFRISRFFKKIEFSFAIRPPLRPKLFSIEPSIISFIGHDVRVTLVNISEPIFNMSFLFSHSSQLANISFIEESFMSISFTIAVPGIPSADINVPLFLNISNVLNNNIKSFLSFEIQMNSFRFLSITPSIFQSTRATPAIIAFITERPSAPTLVTCQLSGINSSAPLNLVLAGTSKTHTSSPSITCSFTGQFNFNSIVDTLIIFNVIYPLSTINIMSSIDLAPYPPAFLESSVAKLISDRKNAFKMKALFLKKSRNSLDIVTSMSIFQSSSSFSFDCSIESLSEDICSFFCTVANLPSGSSFLNISIANIFSNRTAYISLPVLPLNSIRLLGNQPNALSVMGSQLVFLCFVNLPINISNSSINVYFTGGMFSNMSITQFYLNHFKSSAEFELGLFSQFGRFASSRAFLPLVTESVAFEDHNHFSLLVFRAPTILNCNGCFQGSFNSVLNVLIASNALTHSFTMSVAIKGFDRVPPVLELFSSLPEMETNVLYTISFVAKHFPPIYDLIDLDMDIVDHFNFSFVPEFDIISPVSAEVLLISIRVSFSIFGAKILRVRARNFEHAFFDSPVATYPLKVKPYFRIKLIRQSSDFVYANGGPRTVKFTFNDTQESDMKNCDVFIDNHISRVKTVVKYTCSSLQNDCILTLIIPSLATNMTSVKVRLFFLEGEISTELAVLRYPSTPVVFQSKNSIGILSSGGNPDVFVEFTDFPAIGNLSDVVVEIEGSILPLSPLNILSSFLSTQVSFSAPVTTIDARISYKVLIAIIFERGSLCNRSCPGIVYLNYTNSFAAQLQYQSRSTCKVAQSCHVDLFVTNLFAQSLDAFRIAGNTSVEHHLQEFREFLMGPGLNTMSIVKVSVRSNIITSSRIFVSAGFQEFDFSVSFNDPNIPYCSTVYPSIFPTYGGSRITIQLLNVLTLISTSSCRVFWTDSMSSSCQVEKLSVHGAYSVSTLVPVLDKESATYVLALEISDHRILKCGSVQAFAPDTTISISPSSAFSSGGQFIVSFQNFPLLTSVSSIVPVTVETNSFLDTLSFEPLIQNYLLSGRITLSFSNLKPGPHLLKVSHASVSICSATAIVVVLDPTKPRIIKTAPSFGDFNRPSFFELQIEGSIPSNHFLAVGILFTGSGQIFVIPCSVMSVLLEDSIYTATVRLTSSPEPGTCIIQLQFPNGLLINSSNLSLLNPSSPVIQSVCNHFVFLLLYCFLTRIF
jgi:hypothetical protein